MYLMPQLPTPFAEMLAQQLCGLSIAECRQRRGSEHMNRVYSPTGGARISETEYTILCNELSDTAERAGYPQDSASARTRFDVETAILLKAKFDITDNEAAKPGVWNFLSCVALPDLVRWRWQSGSETSIDRFLAGNRNTFGRLWWRAKAYEDSTAADPYWLVREIGEDESVGMMERTALSGIRPLVVVTLKTLVTCHKHNPVIARSDLMRDAMKRLRRFAGIVAIEMLSESELTELCNSIFTRSIQNLNPTVGPKREGRSQPTSNKRHGLQSPVQKTERAPVSAEDLQWLQVEIRKHQGRRRRS